MSDDVVVKHADEAARIELEKQKATDIPVVVYDRENQIIYQEGSDGTRIEAGRSTYTELLKLPVDCINADEIKKNLICSDLDAAQLAERQREEHTEQMSEFCIEMVLSTDCNIKLLEKARQKGYFIV